MKKNILISAMTAFALVGCVEENLDQNGKGQIPTGDGIVFSAVAAYDGDDELGTKTEYGDYEYNGSVKVSQAINWVSDDKVEIYSPSSPNTQQKDYGVRLDAQLSKNQAYLVATGNGVQWDRSSDTQDFYAIYPAVSSMSNETIRDTYVSFKDGVLTGYVPVDQHHTITKTSDGVKAVPVMDYLYMSATNVGVTVPEVGKEEGVSLSFVPLTTTLEITIQGPTNGALAALNVISTDGTPIVGQFSADLVHGTPEGEKYPTCVHVAHGTTNTYATVSLYYDDNGTQRPLELSATESVTLNVFLLPVESLSDIRITLSGFNSNAKSMLLADNGTPITLTPHKKTCVKVKAPAFSGTNTWITNLPDNVYISQLSIPGTANSFSYNYSGTTGAPAEWYRTQSANFDTQWAAGIRCFELVAPHNKGADITNVNLLCNRSSISTSLTFGSAVAQIWQKLQDNPGEFAMVIASYDSNDGHGPGAVANFNNGLNAYFRSHTDYSYITYTPDLTVGEARGKLIFISRITSEEDSQDVITTLAKPVQGVRIEEWGSLRDKWGRRGYAYNGTTVGDWAIGNSTDDPYSVYDMEYHMMYGNNSTTAPTFAPTDTWPVKGTPNYLHATVREDGTASEAGAYVQDWMRVVPATAQGNYQLQNTSNWCYWKESFTEKCNDVWDTFIKATQDNRGKLGKYFYINSLDGYFLHKDIPDSYLPYVQGGLSNGVNFGLGGTAGDVESYATAINEYFYDAILDFGEHNIYGPMNVVIMDMVYADNPSSYLPSVIINNNYRFPLLVKGDATTNYSASVTEGGDAI